MKIRHNSFFNKFILIFLGFFVISLGIYFGVLYVPSSRIDFISQLDNGNQERFAGAIKDSVSEIIVTHIKTPDPLKAVYMTSWAAGNQRFRKELFDLVDNTEINSVVIDIKDYTGKISFPVEDPLLVEIGSAEKRIPDIKKFIAELDRKSVV